MHIVIAVIVISICLVISTACGLTMLLKRREVPDRSRLFLAVFNLFTALLCAFRLVTFIRQPSLQPYNEVLAPFLLTGGLASMVLYLAYPIEVINPGWLNLKRGLALASPALFALALPLCGVRYQLLTSLSNIGPHITEFNVIVRLTMAGFIFAYAFLLLFIPYNWRKTSADKRWILKANLVILIMCVLFFVQVFSTWPFSFHIHVLWVCASFIYFTLFEFLERLKPIPIDEPVIRPLNPSEQRDAMWIQICQMTDSWEVWRNPDTSVETLSTALGSNRIYVARCIRQHTGLTVNDFINKKRVDYMTAELRKDPRRDHKSLYFQAGFRSRQTAYRNFVKFAGCAPSEFVGSL